MNDVHWGKFVLGALIVTAVCFISDGFLHQRLIHDQWLELSAQLGITIRDHAGWKMVYFVVFEAGRGFLTMYVYVLLRPRLGASAKTAAFAGRRRLGDLLAHRTRAVHPAWLLQRKPLDKRRPLPARLLDRGGDRRSCALQRKGCRTLMRLQLMFGACALAASGAAVAHDHEALGTVNFPVSCSPEAQQAFNQRSALLHHMTYPQARAGVSSTSRTIDPKCAMAHWGIAMTLFQPLWPTRPRRGQPAAAVGTRCRKRKALAAADAARTTIRRAAEAFFPRSRFDRLLAAHPALGGGDGETSMRRFPMTPRRAAFYALAHLATAPPNAISQRNADRAAESCCESIARIRIIRARCITWFTPMMCRAANTSRSTSRTSTKRSRRDNPHALHMPTHIYTRLGDWDGVIRGNLLAADAALEFPAGEHGQFVWDEFPHAIEYLVYAYLQKGADDDAAAQLRAAVGDGTTWSPASRPRFISLRRGRAMRSSGTTGRKRRPSRCANRRASTGTSSPGPSLSRFARGLGAAHLGQSDPRAESLRLGELDANATKAGEELFARNIRVLRLELDVWTAQAEKRPAAGVSLMQQAADLETSTPKHSRDTGAHPAGL